MDQKSVLVSILNWNNAVKTLDCVASLERMLADAGVGVQVMVLDNASRLEDFERLREGLTSTRVSLVRNEENLGFTGGHNVAVKAACEQGYQYIWLLNNDLTVRPGTLEKLVASISADPRCGAVSPVILPEDGKHFIAAWGARHDWRGRTIEWASSPEIARRTQDQHPDEVCLAGTAILLRVEALRQVGPLDERLFAYADDSDICTRLSNAGWRSKVVFDAEVVHDWRTLEQQPQYFFYLTARNDPIFWFTHTPQRFRRFLWLKLVNQGLFNINRLRRKGMGRQADAALLGVYDFMRGAGGAPDIERRAPAWLYMVLTLSGWWHRRRLQPIVPVSAGA
jgi:GT2 family glycosyltransferase